MIHFPGCVHGERKKVPKFVSCFSELEFASSAAFIQKNLHSPTHTCTMVPPKKMFCPCIICIYLYVQTLGFLAILAEKPVV